MRPAGAWRSPKEAGYPQFLADFRLLYQDKASSRPYLLVSSNHIIADNKKAFVLDLLSVTVPRSNNSIDKTLAQAEVNSSVNMQ